MLVPLRTEPTGCSRISIPIIFSEHLLSSFFLSLCFFISFALATIRQYCYILISATILLDQKPFCCWCITFNIGFSLDPSDRKSIQTAAGAEACQLIATHTQRPRRTDMMINGGNNWKINGLSIMAASPVRRGHTQIGLIQLEVNFAPNHLLLRPSKTHKMRETASGLHDLIV